MCIKDIFLSGSNAAFALEEKVKAGLSVEPTYEVPSYTEEIHSTAAIDPEEMFSPNFGLSLGFKVPLSDVIFFRYVHFLPLSIANEEELKSRDIKMKSETIVDSYYFELGLGAGGFFLGLIGLI